jgi:hypothetical protein
VFVSTLVPDPKVDTGAALSATILPFRGALRRIC